MSPTTIYHCMKGLNARMMANYIPGIGLTRIVLLLTTIRRKSGLPRINPLEYKTVDGVIYIASACGQEADWFRNIRANPNIRVQIRDCEFDAVAEPVTDPVRIADFIKLRLKRHPVIIHLIMILFDGLPIHFNRADLEKFCHEKAMAILDQCQTMLHPPVSMVGIPAMKKLASEIISWSEELGEATAARCLRQVREYLNSPPNLEGNHLTAGRDLYIAFLQQAGEMAGVDFTEAIGDLQETISNIPEVPGAIRQNDLKKAALYFERVAEAETLAYVMLSKALGAAL